MAKAGPKTKTTKKTPKSSKPAFFKRSEDKGSK